MQQTHYSFKYINPRVLFFCENQGVTLGPMQPGWGNHNRGWRTTSLGDLLERHRGLRAPSTGKPTSQGKGTGASPAHSGAARPKVAVDVVVKGRVRGGGGAILHDDHDGGGVGVATS
jgi:hypothetical protein